MTTRRVALIRNNFLPYSETFIHDELRTHQRYTPTVFARTHSNAERYPGHNVIAVDGPGERRRIRSVLYGLTGLSWRLERAFRAQKFDLVHAHFGHNGLYGMGFAARHDLPLVVSLHGRDVTILMGKDKYQPAWWHYLIGHRLLFKRTTLFLCASTELQSIITDLGAPAEKTRVHRLGVDVGHFVPAKRLDSGPKRVVMVGRFVEKKGHEYGIRAAAIARDAGHDFKLVIVGDGALRPQYLELIDALNLHDQIELTGVLSHSEIIEQLQGAACLMAPSVIAKNLDRESGIIVAKEGSACGLPVLGTLHGGLPDIVDDGQTGYLVPERDAEALGRRLCEVLGDDALRRRLGKAARKKMEREYDLQSRAAALESYYDEAIELYR